MLPTTYGCTMHAAAIKPENCEIYLKYKNKNIDCFKIFLNLQLESFE